MRSRNEGDNSIPRCAAPKQGEVRSKRKQQPGRSWKERTLLLLRFTARREPGFPCRDFTFRGRVSALVFSRGIEIQAGFYCPLPGPQSYKSNFMVSLLSSVRSQTRSRHRLVPAARLRARPLSLLSTGGGRHLIAVIVAEAWTTSERAGAAREKWPETSFAASRARALASAVRN